MSEIRERLKETQRAVNRWKASNNPGDAGLGLQWEFQQLANQIKELEPHWRQDELLFDIIDKAGFEEANLKELGKLEKVDSVFEGEPPMTIFTIEADQYFGLNREQVENLHKTAKLINKRKK